MNNFIDNRRQRVNPARSQFDVGARGRLSQFDKQMPHDDDDDEDVPEYQYENEEETESNRDGSPQSQRALTYQAGYSVLRPDEKKRQAIQDQARRESEAYETYKQQSRPAHVSYVGTLGGGLLDESAARKKTIQENSKYSRIQKQQQYKVAARDRENAEINRKKLEARKKADMNEKQKISEQKHTEQIWKQDHGRKNEEFLRRLENRSSNQRQTSKKEIESTTYISNPSCEGPAASAYDCRHKEQDHGVEYRDSRVKGLSSIFPNYDVTYLSDLLSQTNSVDAVIDLLQR